MFGHGGNPQPVWREPKLRHAADWGLKLGQGVCSFRDYRSALMLMVTFV
jgi:hypothetical protein